MFKGKYNSFFSHRTMVQDSYRTINWKQAIEKTVKKNDIVIDVGSGSGILSIFSAHAGAKKVHAVEKSKDACGLIKKMVARNNLNDVVEVHNCSAAEFLKKNVSADVVLSECIGDHIFEYLPILDVYAIAEKSGARCCIPENFKLFAYPDLIFPKSNLLQSIERNLPEIDFSCFDPDFLSDAPLDTAYFEAYDDSSDFYFGLSSKRPPGHGIKLLEFSSKQKLLNLCDNDNKIQIKIDNFSTCSSGYLLLYFEIQFYKDIVITNHPGRPRTGSHSYFQRLVNLSHNSKKNINLEIDLNIQEDSIEDRPYTNLTLV